MFELKLIILQGGIGRRYTVSQVNSNHSSLGCRPGQTLLQWLNDGSNEVISLGFWTYLYTILSRKQEMEGKQSGLVAQCLRLVSTWVVRGQAQCILSRASAISGAAKGAAAWRGVAARLERRLQEEKEAHWMARGGRCSSIYVAVNPTIE